MKINRIALDRHGIPESDWETEYLKSPTFENVHENLQSDFGQFEIAREKN